MEIVIVLIAVVITGFVGTYIAIEKNRSPSEGFWFGFLLSLFGILIVALLPTKEKHKTLNQIRIDRFDGGVDAIYVKH